MSASSLEDRLDELEMRLTFMEDTLQALAANMAAHDRLIYDLRGEFERIRGDLGAVKSALSHDSREEPPPPHY